MIQDNPESTKTSLWILDEIKQIRDLNFYINIY